jgi:hypothetical protein
MKQFLSIATELNAQRQASLQDPSRYGFDLNRKGLRQKSVSVDVCLRTNDGIKPIGQGFLCYGNQDPNTNQPESQMIRSKIWKPHEVAQMWVFIRDTVYQLAHINPTGINILRKGFMTEDGKIIIDTK